eukprot:4114809-Amphidinium_carterae.1
MGAVDFADAFHKLHLRHDERSMHAAFRTRTGFAVYKRLPFGLASSPLSWVRLAAVLMRLAQSLFDDSELRI